MEDSQIYELIDRKQGETYKRVEDTVRTLTEFIAIENQGIKKSIDNLTGKIEKQNNSVRDLKEWKAGIEGEKIALKNVDDKSGRWITQAIMMVGVLVAICFGVVNSCSSKELRGEIQLKENRKTDSVSPVTRSFKAIPITEDTAFLKRLERERKDQ